jgi:hypothetical protein
MKLERAKANMKTLPLACALLTGFLMSSAAQAQDAEITIRVMGIDESNPDAVMRIINLPDEAQLRQTQPQDNSQAEQQQSHQSGMEIQQEQIEPVEIEALRNQQLQEPMIDLDNMPQQAIDLQGDLEPGDNLSGQNR